jgi:hypothetical protein
MRCLQTLGAIWISSEVGGARFTDLLGELNSVLDGLGGEVRFTPEALHEQLPQG